MGIKKIKALRKSLGLNQSEFGQMVGLKKQSISRYERGDREPNLATIEKIAKALNVKISDIID